MPTLLLIETATEVCSAALVRGGSLLGQRRSAQPNAHSSLLAVFIDQLLKEQNTTPGQLDAVCVSAGPGSYTGLRIGVSTAKGLCYGLGKPLVAVPTLLSMAALYYEQHPDYDGMLCPMLDARRMECYTAFFARTGATPDQLTATAADVIEPGIYNRWLDRGVVTFIGPGAAKTEPLLGQHPNARFDPTFAISALGLAAEGARRLQQGRVEDVAYFEPMYLKDFVAKKSVVRGLHKN